MNQRSAFLIALVLGLLVVLAVPGRAFIEGRTLLPLDILHQMVLPWANDVEHPEIADHYALDAVQEYLPIYQFHADELADGHFPGWNPFNRGGSSYPDNPVRVPFHPIKLLLRYFSVEQIIDAAAVLHFAIAFLAMFLYLRSLGLSPPAMLFGALSWAFCAFFVFNFIHERKIAAISLLPLTLMLLEKLYIHPSTSRMWLLGAVLGLAFLVAGPTAILVFLIVFSLRVLGYWMFEEAPPTAGRFGYLVAAGMIAFAISSPTLLSTAQGLMHNVRDFSYDDGYSLTGKLLDYPMGTLGLLLSAIHPYALGSRESIDALKLFGYTLRLAPFAGSFALFFALIAWRHIWSGRCNRWLLLLLIAGWILMLPPIVQVLSQRNVIILVFMLVVAAALGIDHFLRMSTQQLERSSRVMLLFLLIVWSGFVVREILVSLLENQIHEKLSHGIEMRMSGYLFERYPAWKLAAADRFMELLHLGSLPNLLFLGGLTFIWLFWRLAARNGDRRFRLGVVAIATAAPVLFAMNNIFIIDSRDFPVPAKPDYLNLANIEPGPPRILIPRENRHDRLLLPANMPQLFGLAQVRGYGSLFSLNPALLTNGLPPEHPLYEVLGVNFLVTARDSPVASDAFRQPVYTGELTIRGREHPASRYHITARVESVSSREEATELARADMRPLNERDFRVLFIPGTFSVDAATAGDISVSEETSSRITLLATASNDALLVIGNTYYPGWEATVNGETARIHAVDGAMQGIWINKGTSEVQLRFIHWPSRLGFAMQIALLLVFAAWQIYRALRSRRYSRPA